MTIETWTKGLKGRSAGLCGSTLQSSRRSHEAANADGALEEVGLRVAGFVVADDQPQGARRKEGRERRLHRGPRAEVAGFIGEPERRHRAKPAAEHAGEDIERPVHADHRAR